MTMTCDEVICDDVQADEPNNLTCGQLYGGKFTQLSDVNGGNFTIE